ncbi:putative bifunctional diguanylate cyclase/phosphodiesterase [Actinoplanes sp. NPDC049265]|uniref:putative bifunctional diguanylate cyclase/phosphodiesterase n=1 Tax=Actinoplanes sp. NPDC049265 TaxID=3363902 RepID=UPI00372471C1
MSGSAGASSAGRRLWRVFAMVGLVATVTYLVASSLGQLEVALLAFVVIGVGTIWACFAGPRRYGAEPRSAWLLLGTTASLFLVGVVTRPFVSGLRVPVSLIADLVIIPGYFSLATCFVVLLRSRKSLDWLAVLDGMIVFLAGGLLGVLLLAAPTAAIGDRPVIVSALATAYPIFDVVLLLLVVNLTFTATTFPISMLTFIGSLLMLFAGDLAYAIIGLSGKTYDSPLLDLPYILGMAGLGLTALHPSMVHLGRAARRPVQAWSWRRMTLLAPAVTVPFVLLVLVGDESAAYRLTIGVSGALMMLLLLGRAATAVRAQAAAQRRSEHQAMHDPLTGLPNRRAMSAHIERLLIETPPLDDRRVWVYLLDLDGFKWVNDSWGHDTGDQLVIEVARRLRAAVPHGIRVARTGGDEFLLAYVGEKPGALRIVDEIRSCFTRPLAVHDTEVVISASIGIAHAAADGDAAVTAEALMRDADTAMYRAKAEGPGRSTIFDTSMHDRVRERIELEAELRKALADEQLHVAYQPIVQLDTGRPLGAEALLRWTHPTRGQIPPMSFIPIAEESGMIAQIGTWVREESLRQLAVWRADGTVADDFYLSINVSPRQLNDADLPLIVSAELIKYGVPARAVALEMTESVMVDGSSVTSRVLFELRELGVRLLVDDFGTGFSALGYLRRFPVTGVKIDRSFVSGLGSSLEDEEIVRAVVAMSYALGLTIVAEGVENRGQRDALAAVGVTQAQGWLWGPAVAPGDFAAHWHAGGPAARAAANVPPGKNQRSTGGKAKSRNQLAAENS